MVDFLAAVICEERMGADENCHMGVSKNRVFPPKSSILIGFSIYKPSILNFGVPLFLETPICNQQSLSR